MKKERIELWEENEYHWGVPCGFRPFLMSYFHEEMELNGEKRPCILVAPGGAYYLVSPTEGELVAKKFYEMGYQVLVLTYTTRYFGETPLKLQPLKDISRAVRKIRKCSEEWKVDEHRVSVCGFSAAGHLCASLGVHYMDVPDENPEYKAFSNRPDALILSYPVIHSREYAHQGSIENLLGYHWEEDGVKAGSSRLLENGRTKEHRIPGCQTDEEELQYMSLETQVTGQTPPAFLWQTATDEVVPVQNSYLFAQACQKQGIPYALHIFTDGNHGLSVANEEWAGCQFGEPYELEPFVKVLDAIHAGTVTAEPSEIQALQAVLVPENPETAGKKANKEVEIWPVLADQWLKKLQKKR